MLKSAEIISERKKKYYQENRAKILARYKKRMYDLKKKNRVIPVMKNSMLNSELVEEHSFCFVGKDVSEERFNYYMTII